MSSKTSKNRVGARGSSVGLPQLCRLLLRSSAALLLAGFTYAQSPQAAGGGDSEPLGSGFRFYSVSGFLGYNSVPPWNMPLTGSASSTNVEKGFAAALGWKTVKPAWDLTIAYSPSYYVKPSYSEGSGLGHDLTLRYNWRVSPRLRLRLGSAAQYINSDQFLFQPGAFKTLSEISGSAADLLPGANAGAELLPLLGGGSPINQPSRAILFGNHVLSFGVRGSMEYSLTPKLTLTASTDLWRSQGIRPAVSRFVDGATGLISQSTLGAASAGLSYSLTPNSALNFVAASSRIVSHYEDVYLSTSTMAYSRTFGPYWFASASAGVGRQEPIRPTTERSTGFQYLAGALVGVRASSSRFFGAFNSTIADPYGLGANRGYTLAAAWSYARPTSPWRFDLSGTWQNLQAGGVLQGDLNGWIGQASISRAINRQVRVDAQYTYSSNRTRAAGVADNLLQRGARLSVVWTPHQVPWFLR